MKLKSAWLFGTILCTLPLLFPVPSHAQAPSPSAVFTIGEFNRSSVDLAAGTPQQPVKFIVGTSIASKDWYANQRVEQPFDSRRTGRIAAGHPMDDSIFAGECARAILSIPRRPAD